MEFRDLKKQYRVLQKDMDEAILAAVRSGAYIMGPQVKELERELAAYVGVKHCLTCANGTDALTLALKAWGIGPGDAVFVPDFTFFSSAEVVALEGATPVFVDVEEDTFNLDAADLERAIQAVLAEGQLTPRVVIAVDLFGLPANYPAIRTVADKHGLLILEDGAQGFGGSMVIPSAPSVIPSAPSVIPSAAKESRACSFGDIATTSFFPAKPVGCYGDGGAVFTDNDEWAALVESYRVHGKGTFKYDNVRIGLNSRLDTVQAAVLQVKLKAFAEYELDAVNRAAARYTEILHELGLCHSGDSPVIPSNPSVIPSNPSVIPSDPSVIPSGPSVIPSEAKESLLRTPVIPAGFGSSWAQYTLRLPDRATRDALQTFLKAAGIPAMVYYPKPMHLQTAFADPFVGLRPPRDDKEDSLRPPRDDKEDDRRPSPVIPSEAKESLCPVATSLCERVLSLPIHPYITEEEIRTVCEAVKQALR